MRKKATTRAQMNGLDLAAFKRQHKAFVKQTLARLAALEGFAVDVDICFEEKCAEMRGALVEFDAACAEFVEYQSDESEQ